MSPAKAISVALLFVALSPLGGKHSCSAALAGVAASQGFAATDQIFADYALDAHIPGLVYGVVIDGHLTHVGAFGVQDLVSRRPVSADTLFRIASMTKAFTALTILKLRDAGLVRLDTAAEDYVPELRSWTYPTTDSPRIRVRQLLNHVAGLGTDDPWADRQTPLPEEDFTRLLRGGVPFTRAPGISYEYSNLGYAILGRLITNVSKRPFAETISRTLLRPLGMKSSGFDAEAAPPERRALGYRWEDNAWRLEPTLGPGAFGAIGGLQTSANDYAKWLAFLLSAWPPRDDPDAGPVKRATVREIAEGSNFPSVRPRPGRAVSACAQGVTYGMGIAVVVDCDLGTVLSHSGGYPGYGSYMLLLPERGAGLFAFANRTYSGPSAPVWDAVLTLLRGNQLPPPRVIATSAELAEAYVVAGEIYGAGNIQGYSERLAMNFLLDRDASGRARDLAALKQEVGECATNAPIKPQGALRGEFTWRCTQGRLKGRLELAPTRPPTIQLLTFEVVKP